MLVDPRVGPQRGAVIDPRTDSGQAAGSHKSYERGGDDDGDAEDAGPSHARPTRRTATSHETTRCRSSPTPPKRRCAASPSWRRRSASCATRRWSRSALLIGSQTGRGGVLTQCALEEATELELGMRGMTTYAETISVYGTEKVFMDGDDTPWSKTFLASRLRLARYQDALHLWHRLGGADGERRGPFHAVPRNPLHPDGKGAGVQGLQNGSISCIGVPGAVPAGIRAVLAENLVRSMLTWSARRATISGSPTRTCAARRG